MQGQDARDFECHARAALHNTQSHRAKAEKGYREAKRSAFISGDGMCMCVSLRVLHLDGIAKGKTRERVPVTSNCQRREPRYLLPRPIAKWKGREPATPTSDFRGEGERAGTDH